MIWNSLRMFLSMTLLTGILYPLFITLIAQLALHQKANGDLVFSQKNQPIGSKLIAQKFTADKYFWERPSAVDYNPLPSGGSNLGPTSAALKKTILERRAVYSPKTEIPSELLYASASGLDPHISVEAALFQLDRVAKARNLNPELIHDLINKATHWALFGPSYVNVLILNSTLDGIR